MEFNTIPMTSLTGSLCKVMGVEPPQYGQETIESLVEYVFSNTDGRCVDRVLMYNPDAIGQLSYEKYSQKFQPMRKYTPFELNMITVLPPKTPVCFGSMYTGASPEIHGIQRYVKSLITIDSIFDALIRAGKKPCIVAVKNSSLSKIFNGKNMDYYFEDYDNEVISRAVQLIKQDKYDFIVVYNQEFDDVMHRSHPNSKRSQKALDHHALSFDILGKAVKENWKAHDTLIGCATDHGTHREWYLLGQHGKNIPEDMNIKHYYGVIKRK